LAEWWQEFSIATDEQREDMVAEVREEQRAKPKAAAKPRTAASKNAPKSADSPLDNLLERTEEDDDAEPNNTDPAKKRRRRKRGGAKKPNPAFVPNPTDGSST
jgi:poly(A) polymerase